MVSERRIHGYHGDFMRAARSIVAVVAVAVLQAAAGCATGTRQQRPDQGSLTVGVTTTGGRSDLKFGVLIEPAGITGHLKADAGVFTTDAIPPGEHVVRLTDVPATCRIDGGATRTIVISDERRFVVLRFDVRCG